MVEIYLVDHAKRTMSRIGMADNKPGLFEILQYLIDGMGKEKFDNEVAVKDCATCQYADMHKLRVKYGLRKRTFDERLKNVRTWKED